MNKNILLYRIYYNDEIVYVGRTTQKLIDRLRNHIFKHCLTKHLDINLITKIEYTTCKTIADQYLYEIYYINKFKPKINVDDKAPDELTIKLPELKWLEFKSNLLDKWKTKINKYNDINETEDYIWI